ncbi:RNA-directed DNA polymerase, eukaryota [Tanacetum coccineum]
MAGSGGAVSSSVGNSGGILCVWDPNLFIKEHVSFSDYFLAIMGTWTPTSIKHLISHVYAPQDLTEKKELWGYICTLIDRWEGETMVLGDFNDVRTEHERFDPRLCLDRHLSDHRPILMHESYLDYGTTPFRMFHSWFKLEGFDKFIEDTWNSMTISDSNSDNNVYILNQPSSLMKELQDINSIEVLELSQKAVRWSIEGDENSKYFHGILNNKRSKLSIRGIFADGDWITDPNKFWNLIDQDVVAAVFEFFASGMFPHGCNSSFVALIPKIQDAKVVKDYRPISLIGSMYKIIAKILANRLSFVMPDLISDVQSDFVSNRKILDGPFTLNELLSWCKHKKVNATIFKVDFEKAFDSVRWDYLYDVLSAFGFGVKWRSWITGCLNSAMVSVLVNGCPTSEFHFHKGLKQGDPLSPFLFILVMESFQLSFNRVMDAGLYRGISIKGSLTICHLFYADDAFFVGKWDISNIKTIVHVLKCFFMASGLKINLYKSKLMGVGVSMEDVELTTAMVGCSTLSPLFKYLGVNVGATMSRLNSWNEVSDKISSRLSKWKLKTLSIGGRLTLLKSVLTAIPLYHMSLFKAPIGETALKIQYPRLYALELCKDISVAEKMRQHSLALSFRRSDEFSVKSVRNLIDASLLPKSDVPTRWVKLIPIKVNIIAWRIRLDRLPTRMNLSSRGLEIPSIICSLCNEAAETTSHVFFLKLTYISSSLLSVLQTSYEKRNLGSCKPESIRAWNMFSDTVDAPHKIPFDGYEDV